MAAFGNRFGSLFGQGTNPEYSQAISRGTMIPMSHAQRIASSRGISWSPPQQGDRPGVDAVSYNGQMYVPNPASRPPMVSPQEPRMTAQPQTAPRMLTRPQSNLGSRMPQQPQPQQAPPQQATMPPQGMQQFAQPPAQQTNPATFQPPQFVQPANAAMQNMQSAAQGLVPFDQAAPQQTPLPPLLQSIFAGLQNQQPQQQTTNPLMGLLALLGYGAPPPQPMRLPAMLPAQQAPPPVTPQQQAMAQQSMTPSTMGMAPPQRTGRPLTRLGALMGGQNPSTGLYGY